MWITLLVVVGSVLLVVSGFTWAARRETAELARRIGALSIVPIAQVTPGRLAAVRGSVRVDEPLTDPVTESKVAFYEVRVLRTDGGDRTLHEESRGRTIWIEDESGEIRVELAGAEIALPMIEVERTDAKPSPTMRALLEAGGVEPSAEDRAARFALAHRTLKAGDTLTAVGVVLDEGGARRLSSKAGLLYLTQDSLSALQDREREDLRAMSRMLLTAAAVGLGLMLVGGWLLLTTT